ncbi:MAG: hypothetical protein AAF735_06260 [Myxococcota bacterium]
MIRLGPSNERRLFCDDDIREVVPVLRRVSRRAAGQAAKRAQHYGRLRETEPEWAVLKHEMRAIIQAWSEQVGRLGAQPMEPWTVGFSTADGIEYWRYEPEPEDDQRNATRASR